MHRSFLPPFGNYGALTGFPGKGGDMKTKNLFIIGMVLFTFPVLLFSGTSNPTAGTDSSLSPWIGVWTLTDDQPVYYFNISTPPASTTSALVEIRPAANGKGIGISRKVPQQPDVEEALILDGTKQPLNIKNCSGWQISKWIPERGVIIGSSEANCKDSESVRISSLKIILSANQMVDILGIKTGNKTKVATRRLQFARELPSVTEGNSPWFGALVRKAASAPWNLAWILQLAGTTDDQVLQAALVEKNVSLKLDGKALKQMKAAKLSKENIDILVALAYPDRFHIQTRGKAVQHPLGEASTVAGVPNMYLAGPKTYGYLNEDMFYYNSPVWGDRVIDIRPAPAFTASPSVSMPPGGYSMGGGHSVPLNQYPMAGGSVQQSGGGGYIQQPMPGPAIPREPNPITHGRVSDGGYALPVPVDTGNHATPRGGYIPSGGNFGSPSMPASSGTQSSSPASSGSSAPSSTSSSAPSSTSSSAPSSSSSSATSSTPSSTSSSAPSSPAPAPSASSSPDSGSGGRHATPR